MRIGELAHLAGVTPDTIRFYEKQRLLPAPPRTPSGYRSYETHTLEDLSFIRKGQALGLRLSEIREVMDMTADGQVPCDHVRSSLLARLDDVERRIAELRTLRVTLRGALARLDAAEVPPPGCRCAAIEGTAANTHT